MRRWSKGGGCVSNDSGSGFWVGSYRCEWTALFARCGGCVFSAWRFEREKGRWGWLIDNLLPLETRKQTCMTMLTQLLHSH